MASSTPSSPLPWGTTSSPMDMASSPTGVELTPRAKVRALMAQFDDGSDSEPSPSKTRGALGDATEKANRGTRDANAKGAEAEKKAAALEKDGAEGADAYNRIRAQVLRGETFTPLAITEAKQRDVEEDDELEDEELVMPRGRMAARMQGHKIGAPAPEVGPEPESSPSCGTEVDPASSPIRSALRAEAGQVAEAAETTDLADAAQPASSPTQPLRTHSPSQAEEPVEPAEPASSPSHATQQSETGSEAQGHSPSNPAPRRRFLLRKKVKDSASAEAGEPCNTQANGAALGELAGLAEAQSEADIEPGSPGTNSRFQELLARKRQERQAKEAGEEQQREEKLARMRQQLEEDEAAASKTKKPKKALQYRKVDSHTEDISEGDAEAEAEIDRRLTQQSRPTRKASKKAMEEMSRETQRLSRNMQLAHEARTCKKISKQSFLDRFNFRRSAAATTTTAEKSGPSSSTVNSSAPSSDAEGAKGGHTPPTSPIVASPGAKSRQLHVTELAESLQPVQQDTNAETDTTHVLNGAPAPDLATKGEAPMAEPALESREAGDKTHLGKAIRQRPIQIFTVAAQLRAHGDDDSSDSDLEIMPHKKSAALSALERVQPVSKAGTEGRAMRTLRALAHLQSPGKKKQSKTGANPAFLQANLRKQARQQAARERAEKIEELRGRGIIIQTEEERDRDQDQMEDLLEKARRENEELARREKDAARKEAKAKGEEMPSSDEDEDYQGDNDEQGELRLSGSEDEDEDEDERDGASGEEDDGADGEDLAQAGYDGGLILDAAEEADESEGDADTEESESEHQPAKRRATRGQRAIVDDDDDDEDEIPYGSARQDAPSITAPANPFLQIGSLAKDAPMGLSQAFAATMADSQDAAPANGENDSFTQMSVPDFSVPDQDSPFQHTNLAESNTLDLDLHFSQSQIQEDSMPHANITATQPDIPDPTQDAGFAMSSPAGDRFAPAPPSTIDTVKVGARLEDASPTQPKRGRLQRKKRAVATFSDDEQSHAEESDADDDFEITADAFNVLKTAALKVKSLDETFDKKKSKAHQMVEEQAAESDDEYAGIGGGSDDESAGELDEETKRMIEEGEVEVDERVLAAFHANKERATDEKAVEKLFKDINNGGLRRKRRASLELTDSEDDMEDRRRRKRAEFARMRKALLADENVGQIAEDPKKQAFLHSIEDRDRLGFDEDLLEDDAADAAPSNSVSQDQQSTQEVPESQTEAVSQQQQQLTSMARGVKRKRPLEESRSDPNKRLPAALRRTRDAPRKPTTIAEMRESISFLTENPHSTSMQASFSDGEDGPDDATASFSTSSSVSAFVSGTDAPSAARRTAATAFIDRLQVKRANSLNAAAAEGSRLAFHDPAAASAAPSGFKVPSLLRRATTQLTGGADAHGISHGLPAVATERAAGGVDKGEFVRKLGSGKRTSVNFQAREAAKRVAVEGVERRRVESARKVAEGRRGVLGVLGGGRWD